MTPTVAIEPVRSARPSASRLSGGQPLARWRARWHTRFKNQQKIR